MTEQAPKYDSQPPDHSAMYFRSAFWPHFEGVDVRAPGDYEIKGKLIAVRKINLPGHVGFQGSVRSAEGFLKAQFTSMDEGEVENGTGIKAVFELIAPVREGSSDLVAASLSEGEGIQTVKITRPDVMTDLEAKGLLGIRDPQVPK